MHLFLPYLLNDSQKIHSTIHFSKPLLCVTANLRCLVDWSYLHFIWQIRFVVYRVTLETASFTAPEAAPSGKEWICIFIQTNAEKTKWAGMCQCFTLTSTWNSVGLVLKTTLLFLLRDKTFRCTFRCKTLQDVSITFELCHTLHERSFLKIHNRGTLKCLECLVAMHSEHALTGTLKVK